jgi:hypothetical protein
MIGARLNMSCHMRVSTVPVELQDLLDALLASTTTTTTSTTTRTTEVTPSTTTAESIIDASSTDSNADVRLEINLIMRYFN